MLASSKRISLEKGDELELEYFDSYGQAGRQRIIIEKKIGEGASCLSYLVRAYIDLENSRRMVLKEFYPDPYTTRIDISRNPQTKKISINVCENSEEEKVYQKKKKEFEEAFSLQNHLSDAECGEAMVKPYKISSFGDSIYILSDIFSGKIMREYEMESLEEKLIYMGRLAEAVALIHEQGYLCVDLHPGNVLCIDTPKVVKLFDVDSLVKFDEEKPEQYDGKNQGKYDEKSLIKNSGRIMANFDSDSLLKREESERKEGLKTTLPYGAPEIYLIRKEGFSNDWKRKYLNPGLDIYSLGVMMFELLFERIPQTEDIRSLQRGDFLVRELCRKENLDKNTIIDRIRYILLHSMTKEYYDRFSSAKEMYEAINLLLKEIGFLPFMPKKKIAEANYSYFSYHLLEKYPVYRYAKKENGRWKLDVSIVGSHEMRRQMLKTVLPGAQMLNADLTIRILAEDAEEFWEKFTSENENPDLGKAVVCHWKDEETEDTCDTSLVDSKLADVHLYPVSDQREITDIIKRTESGYVLLFGEEQGNLEIISALGKEEKEDRKIFIGYLTGHDQEQMKEISGNSGIDCYAMGMKRVTEEYNEKMYKSRIYRMGLQIHAYYYRGNETNVSRKKIENDYKSSFYNMESSQRSALHGIYKMASVGIDWESPESAEEFYRQVLSRNDGKCKENFDNLVYLEHRSWTAYMLTHGHRQTSREEFRRYAYEGNNNWKDLRDGNHIKHPCLAASRPGRGLQGIDLETLEDLIMIPDCAEQTDKRDIRTLEEKIKLLDSLDQASRWIHLEICRIAENKKKDIFAVLEEIESAVEMQNDHDLEDEFQWMKMAVAKCFRKEIQSEEIWKKALSAFKNSCEKNEIDDVKLEVHLKKLEKLMRPVVQVIKKHDFKISDEEVIRALPSLFDAEKENRKKILIRPMSGNPLDNIFSCLMLEPQKLILVSDTEKPDVEYYREFLCRKGLDHMIVTSRMSYLDGAKIYIDLTGADPETISRLRSYPQLRDAVEFVIEDRKIKSLGDPSVEMFQKDVFMSVSEVLELSEGADGIADKADFCWKNHVSSDKNSPEPVLEWQQGVNLWERCRKENHFKWTVFTGFLKELEEKKIRTVIPEPDKGIQMYRSRHIPGEMLLFSGLKESLKKLEKWEMIQELFIPKEGDDKPVMFSTSRPKLGKELMEIIQLVTREPFQHHFSVGKQENGLLILADDTLYVETDVPKKEVCDEMGNCFFLDQIVKEELEEINLNGNYDLFQNLEIYPGEKETYISFRYASEAVRDTLQKPEVILKMMLYQECIRNDIFDDIRVVSEWFQVKNRDDRDEDFREKSLDDQDEDFQEKFLDVQNEDFREEPLDSQNEDFRNIQQKDSVWNYVDLIGVKKSRLYWITSRPELDKKEDSQEFSEQWKVLSEIGKIIYIDKDDDLYKKNGEERMTPGRKISQIVMEEEKSSRE